MEGLGNEYAHGAGCENIILGKERKEKKLESKKKKISHKSGNVIENNS